MENDADAALIGEWYAGSAKGFNTVMMLTFGTGIGGSVLVNGKIYRGISGEHPEYGHIPVEAQGPECYCGRSGCFESIASGAAMTAAGQKECLADSREIFEMIPSDGIKVLKAQMGNKAGVVGAAYLPRKRRH